MANTTLNMQLLLRRDNVFTSTYKLAAGEPGFEISTNTLKIGDGVKTWAELPIANKQAIDELIKVVDDKVKALNDTYATDAEVEAIRAALNAAKLDKATYEAYIATHSLTDTEINTAISNVDAKFANYTTTTAQQAIDAAQNSRIEALEAVDHEHSNKALLDTYTQTEANLADAVAKKHSHSFNETELNKIAEGDVAKWNGVAADHLTSADKTTLENAIKEAKQAGTDANTNVETYKVTNDARVKAVEDNVAEITGENGILAQAKTYSDGKLATARTEISAEIDADVKAVNDSLEAYKTSNDGALANVKATADAAAAKTYVDGELAKKVDKVDGKDLISTSEIERLATLKNYDDTQVKADIAKKADAEATTTALAGKVDKVEGYSLVSDVEIARLAEVDNYDDTALAGRVTTAEGKIASLESASATHATKSELEVVDAKFASYNTTAAQKEIDDAQDVRIKAIEDTYLVADDIKDFETKENVKKVADNLAAYIESNDAEIEDRYTKEEADDKFAVKGEDAYDDTAVRGLISDNADAIAAEAERAAGVESGLDTRIKAVEDDYLKAADKTELQNQITANANAISVITNGIDAEKIDGLNDLIEWADEHAPEVKSIKEGIEANTKAIEDEADRATAAEEALSGRVDALEADKEAYKTADDTLKSELQAEIDSGVAAAIAAEVARSDAKAKELADAAQAAAEQTAANELAEAVEDLESKIAAVDTGVMEIEAGNDIVVTPGEDGKVTIAHETFTTGEYTKDPATSDKDGDVYLMTSVKVDNGHVTGANVKSLAEALMGMSFIFDGGTSSN